MSSLPHPSFKRLLRDLDQMMNSDCKTVFASPSSSSDLYEWDAVIFGPEDSIWEGAILKLKMKFSQNYPQSPPYVTFCHQNIFHPNINNKGEICIDILKHNWSPTFTIQSLLLSIQSFLNDPNPESVLNINAAKLFVENPSQYSQMVKNFVSLLTQQQEEQEQNASSMVES